jgi:PAS domain S-box-containing protein
LTPFTAIETRNCETLATHLAAVIENARQHQRTRELVEQLTNNLQLLKTEYSRTKAHLQNRLKQSKEEVTLYIQKLYETELGETRAQNDAREALRRLARLKEESQSEISSARAELERSIEQAAQLTTQLAQLEEQARILERDRKELQLAASAGVGIALAQGVAATGHPGAAGFSAFDHLANGVVVTDPGGRIVYTNPVAEQWLGRSRDQLIGSDGFSLWDSDVWRSAIHSMTDQWPTASPDQVGLSTSLAVEHQGQPMQVELTPLSLDGHHAGAIALLHSVPQADERTRARDEFLASLAQELRTPMTSILGYTELLMNESVGKLGEIQRKFLQRVQANVERMSGMLNDLIGVTTIDSGKLVIELEPVDIVGVIETALRKVQFRLEEKELDTQVEIGDVPVVLADPECVQQIVDNLLTNACKSSQTGSVIGIRANVQTDEPGKPYLHVAVSDTGGGIAPEDRARVFERFYRADNALIAGLGETGVGLAIVKSLVEAHRGRVWNESEMGVGTTFHFVLPLGLEKETGSGSAERAAAGPGSAGGNGRG